MAEIIAKWKATLSGARLVFTDRLNHANEHAVDCGSRDAAQSLIRHLNDHPDDVGRWAALLEWHSATGSTTDQAEMPFEAFMVAVGLGDETTSTASIGRARDHLKRFANLATTANATPAKVVLAQPLLYAVLADVLEMQAELMLRGVDAEESRQDDASEAWDPWPGMFRDVASFLGVTWSAPLSQYTRSDVLALVRDYREAHGATAPEPSDPPAEPESCGCDELLAAQATIDVRDFKIARAQAESSRSFRETTDSQALARERLEQLATAAGLSSTIEVTSAQLFKVVKDKLGHGEAARESGRAMRDVLIGLSGSMATGTDTTAHIIKHVRAHAGDQNAHVHARTSQRDHARDVLRELAGAEPHPASEPDMMSRATLMELRAAIEGKFGGVRATERERLKRWAKTSGLLGTSTANARQLIRHIERKLQAEESGRARAAENSCAWHFMREHAGVEDGESVTYDTMARRIRNQLDAYVTLQEVHEHARRELKTMASEIDELGAVLTV